MHLTFVSLHLCLGALAGLASLSIPIRAEQKLDAAAQAIAPRRGIGGEKIFAELLEHNRIRADTLLEYSASRTYRVSHPDGRAQAQVKDRMEFQAPGTKVFHITSEQGSGIVRRLALKPPITSESGQQRERTVTIAQSRLPTTGWN